MATFTKHGLFSVVCMCFLFPASPAWITLCCYKITCYRYHEVVMKCWAEEPDERPRFSSIVQKISLLLQINARCLASLPNSKPKASVSAVGTTIVHAIEKKKTDVMVKTSAEAKVTPSAEEEQKLTVAIIEDTTAAADEEQRATYTDDVTESDDGNMTIVVVEEPSAAVLGSVKISDEN